MNPNDGVNKAERITLLTTRTHTERTKAASKVHTPKAPPVNTLFALFEPCEISAFRDKRAPTTPYRRVLLGFLAERF